MKDILPLLRQAADRTVTVVRQVRPEQFDQPTPCADWNVKQLITHLEWIADLFAALADKGQMPPQGEYAGDFPARVEVALAAWENPDAWEGVSTGLGQPQAKVAVMFLGDLVTHGWDLAAATGQPYEVEEEAAELVHAFSVSMGAMAQENHVYSERVTVPDDAPALDRMLGISGRDPAWKP
ncbi:TIGR03086 family metal-binding protein [Nonomuraea sp. NPDC050556]|uniref:TIGR03086 family metal-binding protein n=1 Tax=Nonomuraea sp. NPDC050556 TaxID=3364369 RepID=UPI0037B8F6D9